MQQTLWQQGVELMLYGMGTVFVFLTILIVLTSVMSALLSRYVKPETVVTSGAGTPPPASGKDEQLIAVISAAIHKYRSRRK